MFFGSHGRSNNNFYSDLDTFIYYDESHKSDTILRVKEKILEILSSDDEGCFIDFEIDDKWIVYTERSFIKLEIGIKSISEARKDTIYIIESRIPNPEQAIAYDKNGRVKKIYSENWVKLDNFETMKERFISESYKFIENYEKFLSSFGESDSYRTYHNYNIAFHTLVRLQTMVDGNYFNLYQPREFLMSVFYNHDYHLVMRYVQASTGMSRSDIVNRKDKLKHLFLEVIEQGIKNFNIENSLKELSQKFFEKFNLKFPQFSNLRDISLISNRFSDTIRIKEGLIYRAASLSQNNIELVKEFLNDNNIKFIIDLRGKNELKRLNEYNHYYDHDIKEEYVKNVPIEANATFPPPKNPSEHFYIRFLADFKREIRIIFEKHISDAAVNKLIIHCEAGKDRTGIIVAMLLDLLGVSRKLIIEDYLLSFKDTKSYYIESTFKILDEEYGGVNSYLLNHCNVSKEVIDKIIETLVEKDY
ncbi:MAG: tyrosine-protein phosphatase [Candidatus Lokiarchaeota archaeon]|nr:tyrosine-protein phosphatase [Candidatus Lokiarchaeota archaeon]